MTRVPAHLDESDLLAVAEGRGGDAANPKAVRASVEADPALGRLLLDLRADRAELQRSAHILAPANLLDGLEARFERDVLASLVHAAPADLPVPVSSVVVAASSAFRRMLESRGVRRFAAAAVLALVGLSVVLLARNAIQSGNRGTTVGGPNTLALDPRDPNSEPTGGDGGSPMIADAGNAESDALDPDSPPADSSPDATFLAASTSDGASRPPESVAASEAPAAPTMTIARAAELASKGRLAIRVRAAHASAADDVQTIASRSPKEIRWKPLSGAAPLLVVLASRSPAHPRVTPVPPGPSETVITSENPGTPIVPNAAPPTPMPEAAGPELRPLYTVEFEATEARLDSIVQALSRGRTKVVELVELDEPIALSATPDPAAILWWGRKPQDWVKRVVVPVVLETRE